MNPELKRSGVLLIKAAIAAISVWFIVLKVSARDDIVVVVDSFLFSVQDPEKTGMLSVIVLLMGGNWLLETAKWKLLLEYISPTGWLRCIRSVMSGVTVSFLTPNRIGEFAGRIMHLDKGVRVKAAIASVIGSMNQLLITIVAGGIGLITSMELFVQNSMTLQLCKLGVGLGIFFAIFIYFRIPGLTRLAEKFKVLKKINLYTAVFEKYNRITLMNLSFISAARYLVFSIQFILMLHWFDILVPWDDSLKAISVMYLVLAVVPTVAISELSIRGSVALFFFSAYSGNSTGIVAASSMIWFINLAIPALMGALAAFYFRINK